MPETLRDRIHAAADAHVPSPDLARVAGRARTLRLRRTISGTVVVVLACVAVAIPLASLRDLRGVKKLHHPNPAAPTFGDGSISFRAAEGWTVLRGGSLSSCTTTATYADEDVQQSQHLGAHTFLGCSWSAAALPPDGVLLNAYVNSGAYRWEHPNPNFHAWPLPPRLDPATCGVSAYEGQPPGTTECLVLINANHRDVVITVWFGTETPSAALMATAQDGLDTLAVSEPASLGSDIAFEPARGWYDQAVTPSNDPVSVPPSAWTANVELAPTNDQTYPAAELSNGDIRSLPPDGVIVSVQQPIMTRNPLPDTADYQPLPDPPIISDGHLTTGGWEGMPAEDVSQLYLRGVLNGRPIIVQAYFRTTDPSADLIKQAQIGLNRLVVVPAPPPTTELNDFGIGMALPDGWQGWIYAFNAGDPSLVATTVDPQNPYYSANVAQNLGAHDVAIMLEAGGALQDLRWPEIDGPPQIGPENLCVGCEVFDGGRPPAAGHALYHDTFTARGRAFDLYVEFGSGPTEQQLADVNGVLRTLQFSPDPNPAQAPPGGSAVGSLYDGAQPAVQADDTDRTLTWSYAHGRSVSVPGGWTGWTYLVSDPSDPINLYVLGSWNVPQGGYCAPLMALQQLPADGALIWIDRYGSAPPTDVIAVPWPSTPQVGPGTEPAPAATNCTAGALVQTFAWAFDGRTYSVHVAFGPNVTEVNVQAANAALASFTA
jgi:hypothetical protein